MTAKHETRDADVGSLFLIALLLFLCGALIFLGVWVFVHFLRGKEAAEPPAIQVAQTTGAFPRPQLEPKPAVELARVHAAEEARLNSYGWVDRAAGVVHIPIERAMEMVMTRGLPDVGAGQTRLQLMQARPQQDHHR